MRTRERKTFSLFEWLAVVGIVGAILWLVFPRVPQGPPPGYYVERDLDLIKRALMSCLADTGSAPIHVDELPQLVDRHIDVGGDSGCLLSKLIFTGRDYWGNGLQIEPVPGRLSRYTLRSPGPNGVFDRDGDDIVIEYTAPIARSAKPAR